MPALVILIITLIAGATFLVTTHQDSPTSDTFNLSPRNSLESNFGENENRSYIPSEVGNFSGRSDHSDDVDLSEIEEKKARAEDLRSNIEDLNYEIGRLRRNADSYDADEFASKLRRLQYEADDLSSEAGEMEVNDAMSSLDETSYGLQRLKNDIESEPSYFYRNREDDVYSRLKRSESDTDDALSNIDDFSSNLGDY